MADKPILFSSPMIAALLAGRKTQTRREIKWLDGNLEPKPRYSRRYDSSEREPVNPFKRPGCVSRNDSARATCARSARGAISIFQHLKYQCLTQWVRRLVEIGAAAP